MERENKFLIPPMRQTTLQKKKTRKNPYMSKVEYDALKDLFVFNESPDLSACGNSQDSQNESRAKKAGKQKLINKSATARKSSNRPDADLESDSFRSSNLSSESEKWQKKPGATPTKEEQMTPT